VVKTNHKPILASSADSTWRDESLRYWIIDLTLISEGNTSSISYTEEDFDDSMIGQVDPMLNLAKE
jgi:hypothetical protein